MPGRPRRRGFRALGEAGAGGLGLPAARARELTLASEWRRVAGDALSRRIVAVRASRGTLDLEIPEKRWLDALGSAMRDLVGRLAVEAPRLGIRRARVRVAGEDAPAAAFDVEGARVEPARKGTARSDPVPGIGRVEVVPTSREALERLVERYLRAGGAKGSGSLPGGGRSGRP